MSGIFIIGSYVLIGEFRQGSHRLEKYLNIQDYLENQYKIVVSLIGAAYAAPNKGTTIL